MFSYFIHCTIFRFSTAIQIQIFEQIEAVNLVLKVSIQIPKEIRYHF